MIPNILDYQDKVVKKLISLQKIDAENLAIATRQFSASDGSELPAQVVGVTMAEVNKAIDAKKQELAELEAFKADLIAAV